MAKRKYKGKKANDDLQKAIIKAFGGYRGEVFEDVEASLIHYEPGITNPSFAVYLYGTEGSSVFTDQYLGSSVFTDQNAEDYNLQGAMDLLKKKYDLELSHVEFRKLYGKLMVIALIFEVYNVTK